MIFKKSLVLNGLGDQSKKGVLTIEGNNDGSIGKLRLYNFGVEPRGILSLGIYYEGNVVKSGLTNNGGMLYTFKCQMDKLPEAFSCAVINIADGEPNPILYGNSDGYSDSQQVLTQVIDSLKDSKSMEEIENVLDEYGIDFQEEEKEEIEEVVTKCIEETECCEDKKCEDCIYKKYYQTNMLAVNDLEQGKEEINECDENLSFYSEIKEQIDKLFSDNPCEEYLQNLLPNSKWIKVTIGSGDYYVLGIIKEDEKIKYICYGVPGIYQKEPPRELSGYPVWFPLDSEKPEGFGYWLSYQDAENGESVKAVVV